MSRTRILTALAVALALPAAASAQTPTQTFDYTGTGDAVVSGNVYVGSYNGTLGNVAYDIFCVDASTIVYTDRPYDVWVTPLTATGKIEDGLFTKDSNPDAYTQAAWLAMQFDLNSTEEWGAIHQAIWRITDTYEGSGISTNTSGAQFSVAEWIEKAEAGAGSVALSEWSVLTASPEMDLSQEFLVRTNVVPEPGTWAMLLTGLVGLGGVAFRRHRSQEVNEA